jgi:hypothetical protein
MKSFEDTDRGAIMKRLLILFAVILLVFATINAIWFFGYRQRYNHIAGHLEAAYLDGSGGNEMRRYVKEVDGYTITMKMPEYLGQGGFVSVARTGGYVTKTDADGNMIEGSDMYITLFIWPKYFSDYKIGLDFFDEFNGVWEQVEFTSAMEMTNTEALDDEYIEYITQLVSEYNEEITKLIDIAEQTLEISIIRN